MLNRIRRRYAKDGTAGLYEGASRRLSNRIAGSGLPDWLAERTRAEWLTREELLERAEREGRCWCEDGETTALNLPSIGDRLSTAEREARHVYPLRDYVEEPPFVCELPNVRLAGEPPVALASGRLVVETLIARPVEGGRPHDAIRAAVSNAPLSTTGALCGIGTTEASRRLESACLLHNAWTNYYHWTLEHLPKLRALEKYRAETGHTPILMVPPDPPGWMRESLWLAGGDAYPIVEYAPGRVNQLVVPSYPDPTPANCRWLRGRVLERCEDSAGKDRSPRVFVSRRNADRRAVKNESAVMDRLSKLGFVSYQLEKMTVAEQARLFAGSEVVVAPHGAGLSNLVYAEDPAVLELFGERVKPHYHRLATALDLKYDHLLCEPDDGDMIADPEEVAACVRRLLG